MDTAIETIRCPECNYEIDVNELLYKKINEQLEHDYKLKINAEQKKYQEEAKKLNEQLSAFNEEKEGYEQQLKDSVSAGIKMEKEKLEHDLKKKLAAEMQEQYNALQKELNEKSEQLKEFNKAKSEIERLKREKEEIRSQIEAEAEKRLNQQLSEEKVKLQLQAEENAELKIREQGSLIQQLKDQLKEAQRRVEQGSMQAQGEAQELAIEKWLASQFSFDSIEEIKKGARGGDCIQHVTQSNGAICGIIYYESKRTKAFGGDWIEKFKEDIRERNADIGVLVTETMPSDMQRAGLRDGIWICTYPEFKVLCAVLRDSLLRVSNAVVVQENKGDKMTMLYDYLTSNEFRLQIEAIVEGFTQMQSDLEKEKRAMNQIWKQREKQIMKVIDNTNYMYGSMKGIAGDSIQSIPLLEMPSEED